MPNFDGGHYFYTGLFPVRLDSVQRADGSYTVPSHLLRETLATLPNFSESAGAIRTSPFARCHSTHFVRLAVIDEPAFNGRDPVDALKQAVKGIDLLEHQPVDHFSRAWLLFTADFDAVDAGARDRWAAGLWDLMQPELHEIFRHCERFEGVKDGEGFAAHLARGQVETTMSFNDYWIEPPPFPSLSAGAILGVTGIVLLVFLGLGWLVQRQLHTGWWIWPVAALLGLAAGLWAAYKFVNARGAKPFPTAPNSDLKSVLKGLYLQQNLVRFVIEQQGAAPADLHKAFGDFLARTRPADVDQSTQPPGVLHA
ncbi:MAG: hypothetical protein JO276_07090 [Sphingomonadaceae bacterium]|nr:hypothetical protein [Sphingomonadaceae bacterium]